MKKRILLIVLIISICIILFGITYFITSNIIKHKYQNINKEENNINSNNIDTSYNNDTNRIENNQEQYSNINSVLKEENISNKESTKIKVNSKENNNKESLTIVNEVKEEKNNNVVINNNVNDNNDSFPKDTNAKNEVSNNEDIVTLDTISPEIEITYGEPKIEKDNMSLDYLMNLYITKAGTIKDNKTDIMYGYDNTVGVMIVANEKIQPLDGWYLMKDEKVLVKFFNDNTNDEITIKDITGNKTSIKLDINNFIKKDEFSPIWPCNTKVVTAKMEMRFGRLHKGIDIGAYYEPIYAVEDGIVYNSYDAGGYGKYIMIFHSNGYITLYANLSQNRVENGKIVKKGDIVAISGNTGASTGAYLHFEIRKATNITEYFNNDPINPLEILPIEDVQILD